MLMMLVVDHTLNRNYGLLRASAGAIWYLRLSSYIKHYVENVERVLEGVASQVVIAGSLAQIT